MATHAWMTADPGTLAPYELAKYGVWGPHRTWPCWEWRNVEQVIEYLGTSWGGCGPSGYWYDVRDRKVHISKAQGQECHQSWTLHRVVTDILADLQRPAEQLSLWSKSA